MDALPPLRRVAAIHDLSGVGKCSLTVALPVISVTGVECACLPTAVLSTHTGEFTGYVKESLSSLLLPMAAHWKREGVRFDGIYTGYLASCAQAEQVEQVLDLLAEPDTLIVVDPVMADNGEYYDTMDDRMCQAFRRLCGRAQVITPNVTEAALLTGAALPRPPHSRQAMEDILKKLSELGPEAVAVTGFHPEPDLVGNLVYDKKTGRTEAFLRKRQPGLFYGTGDLFASSLTALLVRGLDVFQAAAEATELVARSIARTVARPEIPRRFGVDFEGALPAYLDRIRRILGEKP